MLRLVFCILIIVASALLLIAGIIAGILALLGHFFGKGSEQIMSGFFGGGCLNKDKPDL